MVTDPDLALHGRTCCELLVSTHPDTQGGGAAVASAELREAKRRIRLLEQENEVLPRAAAYLSQANLPGK